MCWSALRLVAPALTSKNEVPAPSHRGLLSAVALFAIVIAWTIVMTPNLRWSGVLHGDEPKYLRYSDALSQGHGFDVSARVPFRDQGPGVAPALVDNLGRLASAVSTDLRTVWSDLRAFVSHPAGFRWNRVSGADGFLTGRHGGVYQIHPPGLSLILLPGYTLDRFLLRSEPGYQDEFPARLVMTTTTLLVMLGGCAAVLYRLLTRALGNRPLAWTWAAIGALTLPLSAFAFQIYPEVAAALIVLVVVTAVRFHEPSRGRLAGAVTGAAALVWLHPRLLIVSTVLIALALLRASRRDRGVVLFAASAVIATFCAYNYHVTGSAWPLAVFDVFASEVSVELGGMPANLVAYAFDRTWGIVAHTPLLLVAPAGLALMWRHDRVSAAGIAAIVLAAAVPAAAHSLSAAGGTPGRLVAAVVPLLIWPVAVFARHAWPFRTTAVLMVLLAAISLDNSMSYNLHHEKSYGPLRDWTASGWKTHQMFPALRGAAWESSWTNFGVLIVLIAAIVGIAIWAVRSQHRGSEDPRLRLRNATTVVLAGFVVAATVATGAVGQWTRGDYLPRHGFALISVADALASRDSCRACLSSARGTVQWRDLRPSVDRFRVETDADGDAVVVRVIVEADSGRAALTRVRCEFGDGAESVWTAVLDQRELPHRYPRPGRYELVTWVDWGTGYRADRRTIEVPAASGSRPAF
jgi:hypothetical protein